MGLPARATPSRFLHRCTALLCAAASIAAGAQQFALKDNSTVVFYGDSITAQRLYTRFVEEFVLTRYPTLHIRFVNAGVPGDTTYGGYAGAMAERVQRDVTPFHPAMITVMLGMNDGGYVAESPRMDGLFQTGYRSLLAKLREENPQATLTLIQPSPYDEITHGSDFPGYSTVLDRNAQDVAQIAAQLRMEGDRNLLLADFHSPLVSALQRAKDRFQQLAPLIVSDRIHPGDVGHWIMAAELLTAWHVDPIVSQLSLDAARAQVLTADRTEVTNLDKTEAGLTWTQKDAALPLPLDINNAMTPVLLGISNIASVDQQALRIQGLPAGQYQLLIDGKLVSSFSSEDLHAGVNLALLKTPMLDQARGIDWSEERRATLDQARFILSAEVKSAATSATAEDRLRDAEDELEATIRTRIVPVAHAFEVRRQR
jgi:lysophospholipase L1-like esterase